MTKAENKSWLFILQALNPALQSELNPQAHFTAVMLINVTLCSGLYVYKSALDEDRSHKTKEAPLSLNNNHLGGGVRQRSYSITPAFLCRVQIKVQ